MKRKSGISIWKIASKIGSRKFPNFHQDFKASKCQGIKFLRVQGFRVPVFEVKSFRVLRFKGTKSFEISRKLGFRVSSFKE
jgi:hypothetical protein